MLHITMHFNPFIAKVADQRLSCSENAIVANQRLVRCENAMVAAWQLAEVELQILVESFVNETTCGPKACHVTITTPAFISCLNLLPLLTHSALRP